MCGLSLKLNLTMNYLSTFKASYRAIVCYIAMALLTSISAKAQASVDEDNVDEADLTVEQNINTPQIRKKAQKATACSEIDALRRALISKGYDAKSVRNGEVLKITIPCSKLFAANDTVLKASGCMYLKALEPIIKKPTSYKVIAAVHCDDTGDDIYATALTEARANAIDEYLWELSGQMETYLIPYGIGHDEPLVKDNSIANRATNRRVDFFIVPLEPLYKR